jgi:hypothetical protein
VSSLPEDLDHGGVAARQRASDRALGIRERGPPALVGLDEGSTPWVLRPVPNSW